LVGLVMLVLLARGRRATEMPIVFQTQSVLSSKRE
jgi:hypothetical protein